MRHDQQQHSPDLVANLDAESWSLRNEVLANDGEQHGVYGIHFLHDQRLAKAHCKLKCRCEIGVLKELC